MPSPCQLHTVVCHVSLLMTRFISLEGTSQVLHPDKLIVHQYPTWSHKPSHLTIQRSPVAPKPPPHHPHGKSYLSIHFITSLQQSWEVASWLLEGWITIIPHLQLSACTLPAPTHGWRYLVGNYQYHETQLLQHSWKGEKSSLLGEKLTWPVPLPKLFSLSPLWGHWFSTHFKTLGEHHMQRWSLFTLVSCYCSSCVYSCTPWQVLWILLTKLIFVL